MNPEDLVEPLVRLTEEETELATQTVEIYGWRFDNLELFPDNDGTALVAASGALALRDCMVVGGLKAQSMLDGTITEMRLPRNRGMSHLHQERLRTVIAINRQRLQVSKSIIEQLEKYFELDPDESLSKLQ